MSTKKVENEVTAKGLKKILWATLQKLEQKTIRPHQADAIAIQSREIVRVVRSQQGILGQANRPITPDLIRYAED